MPARTTSKLMSRPNLEKRLVRLLRELEECHSTVSSPRFRVLQDNNSHNLFGSYLCAQTFLRAMISCLQPLDVSDRVP